MLGLNTDKRFKDTKFVEKQAASRVRRRELLSVLGLALGMEDWFEMPQKKSATDFDVAELRKIKDLALVSPVFDEEIPTPPEVLQKAHGTMIYKNKMILRKSTPYREEIVMDDLDLNDKDLLTFSLPNELEARVEDCTFSKFTEGTFLDIILANGSVHYCTFRNLIPAGVRAPVHLQDDGKSEWLHQPGRWGANSVVPFYNTFRDVCAKVDPNWLINDDGSVPEILYPRGCRFSPVRYRFIVVSRDSARANPEFIPPLGYLVYVGHAYEWTAADWSAAKLPDSERGVWHEESAVYRPRYPTYNPNLPGEDLSYIVQQEDLGYEGAKQLLAGQIDRPYQRVIGGELKDRDRFSTGGKLIVTANYTIGNRPYSKTFHVASTAWEYRSRTMGNDDNLYQYFRQMMSTKNYQPNDPDFLNYFQDLYSIMEFPDTKEEFAEIYDKIKSGSPLPVKIRDAAYLQTLGTTPNGIPNCIWYNFLCCANPSIRQKVFRFRLRYYWELQETASWLVTVMVKPRSVTWEEESKDRAKAYAIITKAKRDPDFLNSPYVYMAYTVQKAGKLGTQVMGLAIKYQGLKQQSIKQSEPLATFRPKSYAETTAVDAPKPKLLTAEEVRTLVKQAKTRKTTTQPRKVRTSATQ
jgi:hypothetical protein